MNAERSGACVYVELQGAGEAVTDWFTAEDLRDRPWP